MLTLDLFLAGADSVIWRYCGSLAGTRSRWLSEVLLEWRGDMAGKVHLPGHAFISYVREDSRKVNLLQQVLEAAGVRVWRDNTDLLPGDDWRMAIKRAITEDALVFIACFSRNSLARLTSYQNEELILAIDQLRLRQPGEPWLIPVRFDDCAIPQIDLGGGRSLSSIQRADLFGDEFDESAARLVAAVHRILHRAGVAPADNGAVPAEHRLQASATQDEGEDHQKIRVPSSASPWGRGQPVSLSHEGHEEPSKLAAEGESGFVLGGRWALYGPLSEAASGGGMMWRAKDRLGGEKWFAVKTAPTGSVSMNTTAYLRELSIRNERRVEHIVSANIGQIIDFGEDHGLVYIVYPLYQPGSLALYCQREGAQRTLRWCAQIVSHILAGLIDTSNVGIIHLDVKPSNIMLDGSTVRVVDWGLSRRWDHADEYEPVVRATPFFASPEQLLRPCPGWDTPLADLYSVGATFYWLITGEAPLRHETGDVDLLTYRYALTDGIRPQPAHELVRGLPQMLSTMIDRWLNFDPASRVPPETPLRSSLHVARGELDALWWQLPEMKVGQVTGTRRKRRRRRLWTITSRIT